MQQLDLLLELPVLLVQLLNDPVVEVLVVAPRRLLARHARHEAVRQLLHAVLAHLGVHLLQLQPLRPAKEVADPQAEAQRQEDDGHGGQDEVDLWVALVDVLPAPLDLEKEIF